MANIDKTGTTPLLGAIPAAAVHQSPTVSATFDLTGGAIVQGDVYQCIALPAGFQVESVHIRTDIPAVGTTLTMNVGDGTSAAGWIGSTDGKAAAGVFDHSNGGVDALAVIATNGTFYAAADSIDVTMTTATAITVGPKFTLFVAGRYLA